MRSEDGPARAGSLDAVRRTGLVKKMCHKCAGCGDIAPARHAKDPLRPAEQPILLQALQSSQTVARGADPRTGTANGSIAAPIRLQQGGRSANTCLRDVHQLARPDSANGHLITT